MSKLSEKFRQLFSSKSTHPHGSSSATTVGGPSSATYGAHGSSVCIDYKTGVNRAEFDFTDEMKLDISPDTSLPVRTKAINGLCDSVATKQLRQGDIDTLVSLTIDILTPTNGTVDARMSVWRLYKSLVKGQFHQLTQMRAIFFYLIKDRKLRTSGSDDEVSAGELDTPQDDIETRLELLNVLTQGGKNINYFQQDVGPFMLDWFEPVIAASGSNSTPPGSIASMHSSTSSAKWTPNLIVPFLEILANLIKFNSSSLNDDLVAGFVRKTCLLLNNTMMEVELQKCLEVLDMIACFFTIPSQVMYSFVVATSRATSLPFDTVKEFCWKVMTSVLNTYMGHLTVTTMLRVIQDTKNHGDITLIRGCIHFLSRAHWGDKKIASLKHPTSSILLAFRQTLASMNDFVAFEVTDATLQLIEPELSYHTWDLILDIANCLIVNYDVCLSNDARFSDKVHEFLTRIENTKDKHPDLEEKMYDILEKCANRRPDESVNKLIEYRTKHIEQAEESLTQSLVKLMDTYYKNDRRPAIRVKALDVLNTFMKDMSWTQEKKTVIDSCILTYLRNVDQDSDYITRNKAVELLIDLLNNCDNCKKCLDILEIVEKIVNRPAEEAKCLENSETINVVIGIDEAIGIEAAIAGLIAMFANKIHSSSPAPAVHAFKLLVTHINAHYADLLVFEGKNHILKREIFDFLLNIRANSFGQIAVVSSGSRKLQFTPYVVCSASQVTANPISTLQSSSPLPLSVAQPSSASASSPLPIHLEEMFKPIVMCLKKEKDWKILSTVLRRLPHLLTNKAIVLLSDHAIVNEIAEACHLLVHERSVCLNELTNTAGQKLTKSEFQCQVFPLITSLITYSREVDSSRQFSLINCLYIGLSPKPRDCILALKLCLLEMRDSMVKHLTQVLLKLSQISATKMLAIPKLEFLSNLTLVPRLYANFVNEQYISIFAIALPYTNPFSFNEYTVALAHRVIAMWFLRCRLPFRKPFVELIINGLQANIMQPLEDNAEQRKRTGSLSNEFKSENKSPLHVHHHHHHHPPFVPSPSPMTPSSTSNIFSFTSDAISHHSSSASTTSNIVKRNSNEKLQMELVEACMDLLSRYTFDIVSTVPQKSPLVDFLLDKTQRSTWLVGSMLVTITTSGCGSRAFHNGLCEKCYRVCKSIDFANNVNAEVAHYMAPGCSSVSSDSDSEFNSSVETEPQRRRHQSAFTPNKVAISKPKSRAYDDSTISQLKSTASSSSCSVNLCSCWCQGWAEVMVRRPTGITSWIMRIENQLNPTSLSSSPPDIPLVDLTAIFSSRFLGKPEDSVEETDKGKATRSESTPPSLRRTTSSPEVDCDAVADGMSELTDTVFATPAEVAELPPVRRQYDLSRTLSLGRGDGMPVERAASFSHRRSPSKGEAMQRRESFSKSKLKCNLSEENKFVTVEASDQKQQTRSTSRTPLSVHSNSDPQRSDSGPIGHRDRVHTISVMSPAQRGPLRPSKNSFPSGHSRENQSRSRATGLSPSFVFLQLFYNASFGVTNERPLLLPKSEAIERAVACLDRITPYEMYSVGVVFVGSDQATNKSAILSNTCGSVRYVEFLKAIGDLIRLKDADSLMTFLGGLDTNGFDGKFTYNWQDNLTQMVFHVATLMPNRDSDPQCNCKFAHIGNDFVCIVYNESGEEFKMSTIKGDCQFIHSCIVVTPLEFGSNLVTVETSTNLSDILGHSEPVVVSDGSLPLYVRQLALHATLASKVHKSPHATVESEGPYVSNWVERLRRIQRIKNDVIEYNRQVNSRNAPGSVCGVLTPQPVGANSPSRNSVAPDNISDPGQLHGENPASSFPDDFTNYV